MAYRELRKNPKTGWYFIQGHVNWYLHGKYVLKFLNRMEKCNPCFRRGECVECGCTFTKVALSNKCKK